MERRHDPELSIAPLESASALAARFYTEPAVLELEREQDQRFSDEIQREDIAICKRVQEGLLSGSYVGGRLSLRRESGVWHFQNLLRQAYRCS